MQIIHLKTNHLENPLGFYLPAIQLSWIVKEASGVQQESARIQISVSEDFSDICYDSGRRKDISSLGFTPELSLAPRTRYYWKVEVWDNAGGSAESAPAWFETAQLGQPWTAQWITGPFDKDTHPLFLRPLQIQKTIKQARVYICGLGLYELYINGEKVGSEVLTPYCNDYNNWVQYQTYDVAELLREGKNAIGVMLGNGWYRGRFGFVANMKCLYGDRFLLTAELHIRYDDGSEDIFTTDGNWLCGKSPVITSGIYDGEEYDARLLPKGWPNPDAALDGFQPSQVIAGPTDKLCERLSPSVRVIERKKPEKLLHTPAGEMVLDFGQLMTGWVEFQCDLPAGTTVELAHGELLQEENFYTENLRTAEQLFRYTSDGTPALVRPHFTFYGYRFVKVTGFETVDINDFTGCVIHSDLMFTGKVETSNAKVNQLFRNALWGQRGNFLDVPTDCPQRDERMGWTGDAQVFAATASFNMETAAFYDKYLHDMRMEQAALNGGVPHVVPDILSQIQSITGETISAYGSCAWGDAAAIIPWTMYLFYGDKAALERQYPGMKLWVEYIRGVDEKDGGGHLWKSGFHFADWLALDNPVQGSSFGRTDPYFIASGYYYYSTLLTSRAAKVLGQEADAAAYATLAEQIREAIRREYFTQTGRLAIDTQTAHVMAIFLELSPAGMSERIIRDLVDMLNKNEGKLNTGFVGTAYLCGVLSGYGQADYAYRLLLNEEYPGWLYEVNMGATTVWERWNSVLPNGLVSDTGMNSMNHYAYGAIVEWMYRVMCGLNPDPEKPGFQHAKIAPVPTSRLEWARAEYCSAMGLYRSGWEKISDGYRFNVEIPFNATAHFLLPGKPITAQINGAAIDLGSMPITLSAGIYVIEATYGTE